MRHVESLEERRYFALGSGVITINGTDAAENWRITQQGGTIFLRQANGTIIDQSSGPVTGIIVNLNGGNDTLRLFLGDGGNISQRVTIGVSINGGAGNDLIWGGAGNDTIRGQGGNDTLRGGPGNDRIIGGNGNDVMDGEGGSDTADYSNNIFSVAVSFDGIANDGIIGDPSDTDTITNFENILGGSGHDILIGNSGANAIDGGAGNDQIAGRGGNDTLTGGIGNDTLWGEAGADAIFAKDGNADGINDGPGTDSAQIDNPGDTATNAPPVSIAASLMAQFASGQFEALAFTTFSSNPPGGFDFSFSGGASYQNPGFSFDVTDVLMQGDKILMVGSAFNEEGNLDFWLMRLNADGTLDTTFGDDDGLGARLGYTRTDFTEGDPSDDVATSITIDDAGRIVVAGYTSANFEDNDYAIARYTASGVLDTSFGEGGLAVRAASLFGNDELYDIVALTHEGVRSYLAIGRNNGEIVQVIRYDDAGTYLGAFTTSFVAPVVDPPLVPMGLAIHGEEHVIVIGDAGGGTSSRVTVSAFNVDGTYLGGGGVIGSGSEYEFHGRGFDLRGDRLVVAGVAFEGENPSRGAVGAATLNFDDGFYLTNVVFDTVREPGVYLEFNEVAFDADNRAVAVGVDTTEGRSAIYRFDTDTLAGDETFYQADVPSFEVPGLILTQIMDGSAIYGVVVQDDGKIVTAGSSILNASEETFAVAMRLNGGTVEQLAGPPELDTTFNPFGTPPGTADFPFIGNIWISDAETALIFDPFTGTFQNKTYLAGTIYGGESQDGFVMRLNEDGSLDASFGDGTGYVTIDTWLFGSLDDAIYDIEVQDDGSLTFVGSSREGEGPADTLFGRLLADGSLDSNIGSGLGYLVNDYSNGGGNDEAVGVVVHTDVDGFPTGYSVAINYDNAGSPAVGLLQLGFEGFGGLVSAITNGGDMIYAVDLVEAPNGDLLLLTNIGDIGEGNVVSAAIFRLDATTGDVLNRTNIVLGGPITNWRANDIAVNAAGQVYVAGSGANGFTEGPSFGVLVSLVDDDGVLVQNDAIYVTQPSEVYFNSVEIDETGAAIAAGQSNGMLAVFRTQPNSVNPDDTYGKDGLVETPVGVYEFFEGHVAVQADGKYVVGGATFFDGQFPVAARFLTEAQEDEDEIAQDIIEDEELPEILPSLVWYNDEGEIQGPLGLYFIYRIQNPNLNNGHLDLFGSEFPETPPTPPSLFMLMAEPALDGSEVDDTFLISRRFTEPDANGNRTEFFYMEINGIAQPSYNIADLTSLTINGGAGKTTVIIENALGIPLTIIGEEDNIEVFVGTTTDGDGNPRSLYMLSTDSNLEGSTVDNGTPDPSDDQYAVKPKANYNGTASFNYFIGDGQGSTAQTVILDIKPVNDAPVGGNKTLADSPEDQLRTISAGTLLAGVSGPANEAGENYSIHTVTSVTGGTVSLNASGDVVFTPDENYFGPAKFTFTIVDDGGAESAVYEATFNVTPVNDAPSSISPDGMSIEENKPAGSIVGTFSAVDIDSTVAQLTYSLVDGPGSDDNHLFEVSPGGVLTSKGPFDYETRTTYSVRVRVTDQGGLWTEKVVSISVLDVAENLKKFTGTVIGTNPSPSSAAREKAFDGKLNTYFKGASNNASTAWTGLDMNTPQTVAQIKFAPPASGGQIMVGGKFQASNTPDFSSGVVTIYTITTAPPTNQLTTVNVNMTGAYRYFRYIGPANSYGQVAEIEFYGFTDQEPPTKPGKPAAANLSMDTVDLTWGASTDNVNVDRYDIYLNGQKIGSSTTTSFQVTGLKANTSYEFKVQAVDSNGNVSPFSDTLKTSTLKDSIVPSKPGNVRTGTVSKNRIEIHWDASTDNVAVSHYVVYRDGKKVGTTTSLSFTDNSVSKNRSYTYTVQAVDAAGNVSLMSDELVVKTLS